VLGAPPAPWDPPVLFEPPVLDVMPPLDEQPAIPRDAISAPARPTNNRFFVFILRASPLCGGSCPNVPNSRANQPNRKCPGALLLALSSECSVKLPFVIEKYRKVKIVFWKEKSIGTQCPLDVPGVEAS